MKVKLELKSDNKILQKAKRYAKESGSSISKLVEDYLAYITTSLPNEQKDSTLIKDLTGILTLPKDYDYKTI